MALSVLKKNVVSALFFFTMALLAGSANANKIQLAYIHIEAMPIIADESTGIVNESTNIADKGTGTESVQYQVMWKQPSNTSDSSLTLHFSQGNLISKAAPLILNGAMIEYFTLTTPQGLANQSLTIVNLEKTSTEIMVKFIDSVNEYSVRLTPSTASYTFKATPSSWQTVKSYSLFGIDHILEGYDHLLFVLCLLLIASTTKKLLWAISGFTLAHSVTLVLSTLNIVQLPIAVVEAVIALSIVFLATEIVKNNKQSLTYRYPVSVSSSFGLLHGFGFASVLMELGLPPQDKFLALGFFNVGVELGQLLFISVVLMLFWVVKKMINITQIQKIKYEKINAYFIGSWASMWLIERVMQF